ncbi:MAG TPA: O-antigen ligase family protein [Bryobacteraceae bacterium]|nr:O-antigen ligase family protein [Bryobacteraceae bacterium]
MAASGLAHNFRTADFNRVALYALFAVLCAFTLTNWDGGEIASRILSGLVLALAAVFLASPQNHKLMLGVPGVCLLCMVAYGILQTLFFPQKILSYGWSGVLFWFTAAMITIMSARLFRASRYASQFRLLFIIFGTAVCVLDLLQQASHTSKYFWLIQSRYQLISGPFSYWNNFAQFVELLLPVTLWRGLASRRLGVPYLLSAALQIGAVVASGSRAGTVLVVLELIAVIGLAYGRSRNKTLLLGAGLAIALSLIFVYAAGFETLIYKLQQNDQLTVRRNIDRSSLAMIHVHPLAGWGLDTYVPVYRMFARYDDGTYVNRAHNDWLQWAAEGGVFFAGAMLVVVLWSIRPAIRSGWGIGLIAICLHALVDYPFARFGVCSWYFCLLGMLLAMRLNQQSHQAGRLNATDAPFGLRPAPHSL